VSFFDTLKKEWLRKFLDRRVREGVIRRLIGKWLQAGVWEKGQLSYPEDGTPQGGVISPLLSNIYLHEVLDCWYVEEVKPRMKGKTFLVRFADDFILGFDLPLRDSVQVRQSRELKAVFGMDRAISGQLFLGLNTSKPPFNDVRVRRAVAHAIDKNIIWQRVFFGLGGAATGPVSRYIGPQYNRSVTKYEYSPQRANQLLDEAGLARGAGGMRVRLRLAVDGSSADFTRIADIVREQLSEVGIELTVESFDFNTWFDRVYVRRDYDISTGRRLTGPDAIFAMHREFHSTNTQPAQRNYYLYRSAEVDQAIEAGLVETDPAKRLQAAHRLQDMIARDVPNIFLMDTPQPNAYRSVFQGLDNSPWGAVRLDEVWMTGP